MKRVAVVGAGFSGAVIAFKLRAAGYRPEVFEAYDHVGGHCATMRDPDTNVMIHKYGPHIFHTNNERVWNFIRQFGEMVPYTHRVKAFVGGNIYSLPINLHTINQFFGRAFNPAQARQFIESINVIRPRRPETFEEQAEEMIGRDLYKAFFHDYTVKQWGRSPTTLPATILKRLPLRFNYDDRYFSHPYQAIPRDGYSALIENMLDGITVNLKSPFPRARAPSFDHVFYTGPLDGWFNYSIGRLPYRTLNFIFDRRDGDGQGAPVINYCDSSVPYTRITEYKHFTPWETHERTILCTEYSREAMPGDAPYYPIRLASGNELVAAYGEMAAKEHNVTFVGRLGRFEYLDMDQCIVLALDVASKFLGGL